jgi:hypothetical protein
MKKWDDIKHRGMTPRQIKAAKKRVLKQNEFVRELVAHFASFRPHLDVTVMANGVIISPSNKGRKTKDE